MVCLLKYHIRNIFFILFIFCFALTGMAKDFVVVIDAGHGGHDMGAVGLKSYEKNINLDVARKVGDMISSKIDNVKVIYTRDSDKYLTLQERANLANKANGDLFISIHTNSIDKKSRNRTSVSGASTYTLGLHRTEENLAVAKRENSVIALEDDYTTTYQGFDPNSTESYIIFEISQSKHMEQSVNFASEIQKEFVNVANRYDKGVRQAGFWVLAATSMPAVLIELDFICNPTQEDFLISEEGQNKMAKSIFNAFKGYKNASDTKIASVSTPTKKVTKKEKEETANIDNKIYVAPNYQSKVKDVSDEDYKYSIRRSNKIDKSRSEKNKSSNKSKKKSSKNETKQDIDDFVINSNDDKNDQNIEEEVKVENAKSKEDKEPDTIFRIQFLTSPKSLKANSSFFKNLYPVSNYKDGGLYKYTYGETKSQNEAKRLLNYVKTKFKEAFIVSFKDGVRTNK